MTGVKAGPQGAVSGQYGLFLLGGWNWEPVPLNLRAKAAVDRLHTATICT